MTESVKKGLVAVGVITLSASGAFAGVLTDDVVFDMSDITHIFAGLVAAGVTLYGIRKAKALIGA